jgi:hypothetical protein
VTAVHVALFWHNCLQPSTEINEFASRPKSMQNSPGKDAHVDSAGSGGMVVGSVVVVVVGGSVVMAGVEVAVAVAAVVVAALATGRRLDSQPLAVTG